MSVVYSENAVHRANMLGYEQTKQSAVAAAAGNATSIRNAEIAFYQSCRSSAISNGCGYSQFVSALEELLAQ
jgi:hypothetical protein